jgi:hypothetical protein
VWISQLSATSWIQVPTLERKAPVHRKRKAGYSNAARNPCPGGAGAGPGTGPGTGAEAAAAAAAASAGVSWGRRSAYDFFALFFAAAIAARFLA